MLPYLDIIFYSDKQNYMDFLVQICSDSHLNLLLLLLVVCVLLCNYVCNICLGVHEHGIAHATRWQLNNFVNNNKTVFCLSVEACCCKGCDGCYVWFLL